MILKLDAYKKIGANQRGQKCGRGWVGLKGACRRAKKGASKDEKKEAFRASAKALADKIRKERGLKSRDKVAAAPKEAAPKKRTAKKAPDKKKKPQAASTEADGLQRKPYRIPAKGKARLNAADPADDFYNGGAQNAFRRGPNDKGAMIFPIDKPVKSDQLSDLAETRGFSLNSDGGPVVAGTATGKGDRELATFYAPGAVKGDVRAPIEASLKRLGGKESKYFGVKRYSFALEDGNIRELTPKEKQSLDREEARHKSHRRAIKEVESLQEEVSLFQAVGDRTAKQILKEPGFADLVKIHQETTDQIWKSEDQEFGRKPPKKPTRKQLETQIAQEAKDWARSQGFDGDGVNGFSAEATNAHDVAHPATHRLISMNSEDINKAFGGLKDSQGEPSLLAEEALVNVAEHLSRGDTKDASIQNGLRLAKVLSRGASEAERNYVRSDEFARGIIDLVENRMYKNDSYSKIMPIIRDSNMISGTVMSSGADFTNSASGG